VEEDAAERVVARRRLRKQKRSMRAIQIIFSWTTLLKT
jgi:hypothetical protein